MRRFEKKIEKVEVSKNTLVACNKCGKETTKEDCRWDTEYQNIKLSFGYGSGHDSENWNFDICEECLITYVKTFKYVPRGFKIDGSLILMQDESDEHQATFENWKKTGRWVWEEFVSIETLERVKEFF